MTSGGISVRGLISLWIIFYHEKHERHETICCSGSFLLAVLGPNLNQGYLCFDVMGMLVPFMLLTAAR